MSRKQPVTILLAVSAYLSACCAVNAAPTSLSPSPTVVPDGLSVIYDPATGSLATRAPDGAPLSAFEVRSAGEVFLGTCLNTEGPFDVCSAQKIFKLDTKGFERVDFGPAAPSNLTSEFLLSDLTVDGASIGGDFNVGSGQYLVVVPEPVAGSLFALGMLILGIVRRRA